MKPAEVAKENDEQLRLSLAETEKHLFKLRFQSATDRLETPSEIRKAKKDIARIRTEQRRRELLAEGKLSDEVLAATVALAEKGEIAEGKPMLGRRKALRVVQRIQQIQATRAEARKMPTAKGK
jgi:large subunit ribosomal protein L29